MINKKMNTLKMKSLNNTPVAALAILLSGSMLLAACGGKDNKQQKQAEVQEQSSIDNAPVQYVVLQKGKLSSNLQVPGELQPYQEVDLFAKMNSYVKKLWVDIGSQVHQGQLLVTLEAPELNHQVAEAQSRIKQQEALYMASKATYDRLFNTSKTPGTVAQNDLEQAEARKNSDYANLEAARSAYKVAQTNLAYLEIRAPFDGVISARNVNLGAYVGPSGAGSSQPLLVLQQQNRLRLVISVPEVNTGGLNNNDKVEFTVRSLPNQKFTAQVKRLAGALDERLRSERLEMDVYNPNKRLLPGMYAEVTIPVTSHDSAFIAPKNAVVASTEKVFVIKVTDDNHAQWIDVHKGLSTKDQVEVFSSELHAGDKLVINATDEIRDGQSLKPKQAGGAEEQATEPGKQSGGDHTKGKKGKND